METIAWECGQRRKMTAFGHVIAEQDGGWLLCQIDDHSHRPDLIGHQVAVHRDSIVEV